MKTGTEYAFSKEKRLFDLAVAGAITPPAKLAQLALMPAASRHAGHRIQPVFDQERVGQNGEPFVVHKLMTLQGDTRRPLNRLAQVFRNYGIDELRQAHNIIDGEMSVTGHRPIPSPLYDAMLSKADSSLADDWERIVLPTRPGVLSTFSISRHREFDTAPLRANERLESDINDVLNGSLTNDVGMIRWALGAAARGET